MTYFDHIKGGVPLPDPEKCDKPCKDQDGKEEEGTVGEKVLGNRLPKEGKRQPGYNTRHHTTIQHALHNRFFLLHCRQEAAFCRPILQGLLVLGDKLSAYKTAKQGFAKYPQESKLFHHALK